MFYECFENNRDYQIRNQTIAFLHKQNIDTTKAVDISRIISKMDEPITWEFVDLDGLPGFTCFNRNKRKHKMFLDRETGERCLERIIFTMAHELGHIVLKHFGAYNNSTYIINRRFEYEANIFADELLMPTKPILENKMTVEEVIKTYLVSESAASLKVKHLQRNTLYRQDRQACSIVFSILDRFNLLEKKQQKSIEDIDEYNEKVINQCLEKWLEPN